jgi:hypothetical protein
MSVHDPDTKDRFGLEEGLEAEHGDEICRAMSSWPLFRCITHPPGIRLLSE